MEIDDYKYGFLILYQDGSNFIEEFPKEHYHLIIIVCSGTIKVKVDEQIFELTAQYCVLLSQNVLSEITNISKTTAYYQIYFNSEYFFEGIDFSPRLFIELFVANHCIVFKFEEEIFERSILILQLLHKNFEKPHEIFYNRIIKYNFSLLLLELVGFYFQKTKSENHWRSKRIQLSSEFYRYVENYFKTEHYVEFYAGKVSVTSAHLGRVVREVTGKSAKEIIDQFILLEAKYLLQTTDLSVSQIGTNLGFNSLAFFSYYFKKHTGVSPSIYRYNIKL